VHDLAVTSRRAQAEETAVLHREDAARRRTS
jgi:hypothetical protein